MARIIDLEERRRRPPDNIITPRPLEFRRAGWDSSDFVLMRRSESERLEKRRGENLRDGRPGVPGLPPHFVLRGSMGCTVRGLYFHKENEESMRDVYYLAGLVDCMINQVSPLLRTGAIRDLYRKVSVLKQTLNVNWYGSIDQVLFPIDAHLYNEGAYRYALSEARSLQQLYGTVRNGVEDMFAVLAAEYVFYTPGMGERHGR
ncbi:MAG: hypothetical protein ACQET7_11030 [Thermodesulfobacteriota bacterium]